MRLVKDARYAARWFSVQAFAVLAALPLVWAELPPELRAWIPPEYHPWIVAAVAMGGLVGRMIDQGGEQ